MEPGASATNDRRPEFQRMIEAGTSKPAPVDVVIVHSFSRFFRDHFELEFYVRKLAKNGVKLVSITQEMGDDPMHVMMRQIMALFDEYQSKENAKHVIRALKENARRGFWNGSLPPIGYRVVAAEQRGAKVKMKLEIDPLHAETVRLIYRLALHGDVADLNDPALKDRIDGLKAIRDQAKADAERAQATLENSGIKAVTPQLVRTFAETARRHIRLDGGGYRRDHLRALAQRVEVADREVHIMGSKSRLLQVLTGKIGVNSLPNQGLKWRATTDDDEHYVYAIAL